MTTPPRTLEGPREGEERVPRPWITVGARVTWLKQVRGAYGGTYSIPAVVVGITAQRVRVAFIERRPNLGDTVRRRRSVMDYSLRPRSADAEIDQPHWSCQP